jgi:hypothetical protein
MAPAAYCPLTPGRGATVRHLGDTPEKSSVEGRAEALEEQRTPRGVVAQEADAAVASGQSQPWPPASRSIVIS